MRFFCFLILSFLIVSCDAGYNKADKAAVLNSQPYDTAAFKSKAAGIDAFFQSIASKQNFSGSVLVSYNEHVLYRKAFGYNNPSKKLLPLKSRSVFQLASVSKQFTAAAIMKLAEEKRLSIDDSVQKFFPGFPYKNISIRLLLTHRAGLGNYTYFTEKITDRKTPLSNKGVVDLMIQHQPSIYFFPNRKMDYSNTGYVILAAIVEQVSGRSFKDYMEQEIFRPLGMKHTYVLAVDHLGDFKYVDGWDRWGARVRHDYLDGATGDKGIYSNVDDLFIWDRALYDGKFLNDSSIQQMYAAGSPQLEGPFNYGFGWRTYTLKTGETIVYHGGWWNGFKSFFMRDIENRHSIIILCNNERSNFRNLDPLVDILYERKETPEAFSAYLHHSPGRK